MKYVLYSNERWGFHEDYVLKKGIATLVLCFSMKSGTISVDVPEEYQFGDEFDSRDFEYDYQIEDTGEEILEDFEIYCEDDLIAQEIQITLDEQYDPNLDDYYDFREWLESNGWEYATHNVYISDLGLDLEE
jgi:hypothetical protein